MVPTLSVQANVKNFPTDFIPSNVSPSHFGALLETREIKIYKITVLDKRTFKFFKYCVSASVMLQLTKILLQKYKKHSSKIHTITN